jgi:hypothetical protein
MRYSIFSFVFVLAHSGLAPAALAHASDANLQISAVVLDTCSIETGTDARRPVQVNCASGSLPTIRTPTVAPGSGTAGGAMTSFLGALNSSAAQTTSNGEGGQQMIVIEF